MQHAKQCFGTLTTIVGVAGVLLSILGIIALWRAATVFTNQAVATADLAIAINTNADRTVHRANDVVGRMQENLIAVSTPQSRPDGSQPTAAETPLARTLDDRFVRILSETRNLLLSVQSGANVLNQAVGLFDSLSSPARMFGKRSSKKEDSDLADLSRSTEEALVLIQQVIDNVENAKSTGLTKQQALELQQAIDQLASRLEIGRTQLSAVSESLEDARVRIQEKRDRLPFWTNLVAAFLTALLICFAFTQVHLVEYGRTIVARNSPPLSAPAEA